MTEIKEPNSEWFQRAKHEYHLKKCWLALVFEFRTFFYLVYAKCTRTKRKIKYSLEGEKTSRVIISSWLYFVSRLVRVHSRFLYNEKSVRNSKTRANQHFFKVIFVFTTLKSFGIRFFHLSYIFTVDQCYQTQPHKSFNFETRGRDHRQIYCAPVPYVNFT